MSQDRNPPTSTEEALARARRHARKAAAEATAALHALLDAGALAATGSTAQQSGVLGAAARGLGELRAILDTDGPNPDALFEAVGQALDAEISRWEARSAEDPDARAVLRAFLGVRELLWELGVRKPSGRAAGPEAAPGPERARPGPRSRGRQVRHLRVEG